MFLKVSAGNNVLSRRDGHDADSGRGDSDPGLGSPFEQGDENRVCSYFVTRSLSFRIS